MKTIVKSPKQQLKEHFASRQFVRKDRGLGKHTSDWCEFHLGDKVKDKGDDRHVGVICAIDNSAYAVIRWEETGWKSASLLRDLKKYVEE